jgi:hypothetical protein
VTLALFVGSRSGTGDGSTRWLYRAIRGAWIPRNGCAHRRSAQTGQRVRHCDGSGPRSQYIVSCLRWDLRKHSCVSSVRTCYVPSFAYMRTEVSSHAAWIDAAYHANLLRAALNALDTAAGLTGRRQSQLNELERQKRVEDELRAVREEEREEELAKSRELLAIQEAELEAEQEAARAKVRDEKARANAERERRGYAAMAHKAHEEHVKSEARRASVAGVAANLEHQSALRAAQLRDPTVSLDSAHGVLPESVGGAASHLRFLVGLAVLRAMLSPPRDPEAAPIVAAEENAVNATCGDMRRAKRALDEVLALAENSRVAALLKARTDKLGGETPVAAVMRLVFGAARGPGSAKGASTFTIPRLEAR